MRLYEEADEDPDDFMEEEMVPASSVRPEDYAIDPALYEKWAAEGEDDDEEDLD